MPGPTSASPRCRRAQSHGNPAGDTSTNPTNPRYYVSGTNLLIKTNYRDWTSGTVAGVAAGGEQMVSGGDVAPGPDTFSANGRSGKIYRFVSWRDENCSGNRCPGTQDSKRVTVAVVLDAARGGPSKPLWFSSIVNNPDAGAPGSHSPPVSNPGTGSNVSAQPFFLTDTGCNQAARQVPAGSHATDDTSRASTTCASATRPDLMVPDLPTMGVEPLLDFSTDLIRTNPLGLALKRRDATCPVTYTATDAPEAKKSIHTWASPPMAATFTAPSTNAASALSFYTRTVDAAAAGATLCFTLQKQSGTGTLTTLATGTYALAEWPTELTGLSFVVTHSAFTVATNERLRLALSVKSTSGADIEIVYDHPNFQSLLSVATTTPIT